MGSSAPSQIDDSDIQSFLASKFSDPSRPLGNPDNQTIYVLNYPVSTSITAFGSTSCSDFDGYHSSFQDPSSGTTIIYAVIARCAGYTINDQTETMSHELVEAATDPDADFGAYYGLPDEFAIWNTLSYGDETSDLCQVYSASYYTPSSIGFSIQKSWSNAAAAAGQNPCVPAIAGKDYYNARPILSDSVSYTDPQMGNRTTTTTGVSIPVGQSRTIELDLMGTNPGLTFSLSAAEPSGASHLSFSFDKSTGVVGDKIKLTITVHSKNHDYGSAEPFWIISTSGGVSYYWPVVVGN
jgi:hypothetical protein